MLNLIDAQTPPPNQKPPAPVETESGLWDRLAAATAWEATPLGPVDAWPPYLRAVVETMLHSRHAMMLAWGPELTLIYNDAYASFLGSRHPSSLGRPFRTVWMDIWSDIGALVDRALAGEAVWLEDFHLVIERGAGPEDTWWNFSYSPVHDDQGQIVGLLNVASEMTRNVLALRRQDFRIELDSQLRLLKGTREITRGAIESLSRYLNVSHAVYAEIDEARVNVLGEWAGRASQNQIGVHWPAIFDTEMLADLARGRAVALVDATTPEASTPVDAKRKVEAQIAAFLAVPLIRNGKLIAALALNEPAPRVWSQSEIDICGEVAQRIWDAVSRSRLQDELRALNATLEGRVAQRTTELEHLHEQRRQSQKLEAIGALTGGVAHDFNNLLSPIVGSLDILYRRGLGNERERRLIEGAIQSAERARVLVQHLLAFARRQPLQTRSVDLAELVEGMTPLIDTALGPQIALHLTLECQLPEARVDPDQIETALLNLCANAADAMPHGGTLSIQLRSALVDDRVSSPLSLGQYLVVSLTDTGSGMDKETLSRAVEPFFSTKGVGKATGLGLSMVHGLAAQLGGDLRLHSESGRGTTVELWLPASEQAVGVGTPDPLSAPAPYGTSALLVDDEDFVRAATAAMLVDLGYTVTEARSAEDALRLIDEGIEIDILVTDHLMTGQTGTDLARALRLRQPSVRVLVVSGFTDIASVTPNLARLSKPFTQADLARSLAQIDRR